MKSITSLHINTISYFNNALYNSINNLLLQKYRVFRYVKNAKPSYLAIKEIKTQCLIKLIPYRFLNIETKLYETHALDAADILEVVLNDVDTQIKVMSSKPYFETGVSGEPTPQPSPTPKPSPTPQPSPTPPTPPSSNQRVVGYITSWDHYSHGVYSWRDEAANMMTHVNYAYAMISYSHTKNTYYVDMADPWADSGDCAGAADCWGDQPKCLKFDSSINNIVNSCGPATSPTVNMAPYIGAIAIDNSNICLEQNDCWNAGGSPVSTRSPLCGANLNTFTHPYDTSHDCYSCTSVPTVCGMYNQLLNNKTGVRADYPHLKFIICIGGWYDSNYFSFAVNDTYRNSFVDSVVQFVTVLGFDGVDFDWEYPVFEHPGEANDPNEPNDPNDFNNSNNIIEGIEDDDCPAGSVCMHALNYCDNTTGGNSTPSKQCQNGAKPCCMPLGPAPAPPASPTPAPPASPTPYCADPSNCKHRPATPTPPIPATPTPAGSASDKKYVMYVPIYGPPTELPKISTNPLNFPAAFINDLAGINPNTNITHLNLAFFSYNNLANTNLGNTNLGSSFIRRSDGKGNYYYNNPVHLIFLPINESNILWGTDATISNLKKAVNNASIIASIGGEKGWNSVVYTEPPNNTIADANIFSDYIKQYSLDGIDIDWEDPTEGAPKLKQISTVKWVCLYTKTIHDNLPSKNIISHAPQAPYFGLGYENIHTTCGNIIDYYNIQYYNQGTNCTYNSFDTIIQNPGCWANSSAVNQIKTMYNVPLSKIIIGKPVLGGPPPTGDADNTGYITQQVFTSILTKCSTDPTCKNIGGIMGWRWHPGQNGEWITSLRKALEPGK